MTDPRVSTVLERLEEVTEAATRGPWKVDPDKRRDLDIRVNSADWEIAWVCADAGDVPDDDQTQSEANAALIATSRNALPVLLLCAKALVKRQEQHGLGCPAGFVDRAGKGFVCTCGKAEGDAALEALVGLMEEEGKS